MYPELTYVWTNWVFSCYRCNVEKKQDKWLLEGYVDPGASDPCERPERYFDYDHATGEVVLNPGLEAEASRRANRTIADLGLNDLGLRWARRHWIEKVKKLLSDRPFSEWPAVIEYYTHPSIEFSGIATMFLRQYLPTN